MPCRRSLQQPVVKGGAMKDTYSTTERRRSALSSVIDLCWKTNGPDRHLDVEIALAVFPSLLELPVLETGVWRHGDGTRVRALRYSALVSAARTLVPMGYWIEQSSDKVCVCGNLGKWANSHPVEALAICISALSVIYNEQHPLTGC